MITNLAFKRSPRRRRSKSLLLGVVFGLVAWSVAIEAETSDPAATKPAAEKALVTPPPTRDELAAAIDRGLTFLLRSQNSNGWWSTSEQPAVTALVLTAFNREPAGRFRSNRPSELRQAYDFVLGSAKPDGSIHRGTFINYNTSLSLLALATADEPTFLPVIRAARDYLAGSQIDFGEAGKVDTEFDGGVGYGSKYQHSDLNNTLTAIEAMRWSQQARPSTDLPPGTPPDPDLNWAAVVHFIESCQNLPAHNPASWVSDDPRDRGGFVYYPGHSMAGGVTNSVTGKVALRSYGSISYAGLLSYLYAQVDRDDPRVKAVMGWLQSNYTLEENPALGAQGYYYYLHLLTKALLAARVTTLRLEDGREIRWRDEVAVKLLELQRPDGAWSNPEQRWWETDPNLVTAYVVLSLEMLYSAPTGP
ncbi:MAG: prenyltransferase/squalene oxidase repeat-containing protein [Limisphaerales bacterium]